MPKFPQWSVYVHMAVVLIAVVSAIVVTQNPLGLLGLFFMPQVPFMLWGQRPEVPEKSNPIGFLADLGSDDDDEFDTEKSVKK